VGVCAILTLLLFAADVPTAPDTDAQVAERAEAEFREGCRLRESGDSGTKAFQTAAALYETLLSRNISNPILYHNLGNAYVLADDLPHAILTFRRGLRLAPYDAGLRQNLDAARELVVYSADNPLGHPVPERRLSWLSSYTATVLLIIAFVCYGGMCVACTRWLMTQRGWLLAVAALCLLAAVLPTALLIWQLLDADHRQHNETGHTLVVIKDDGVLLRKGDSLTYPPRYETPVNRGVEARLVRERNDWVQIELTGGEVGWVSRKFVLIDRLDAD
jgi:tetratricopeptide (TPR) repeat protein